MFRAIRPIISGYKFYSVFNNFYSNFIFILKKLLNINKYIIYQKFTELNFVKFRTLKLKIAIQHPSYNQIKCIRVTTKGCGAVDGVAPLLIIGLEFEPWI